MKTRKKPREIGNTPVCILSGNRTQMGFKYSIGGARLRRSQHPHAGKDTSPKQVRIKDTVPKEPVADCSFCGGTGHTYAICMVLKQMVQEQAELLQRQRTEEYREAQSRSVRQTIVEEYGAEGDPSRRGNVHPGGVLQPRRMGMDTLTAPTAVNPGVNCPIPQLPP